MWSGCGKTISRPHMLCFHNKLTMLEFRFSFSHINVYPSIRQHDPSGAKAAAEGIIWKPPHPITHPIHHLPCPRSLCSIFLCRPVAQLRVLTSESFQESSKSWSENLQFILHTFAKKKYQMKLLLRLRPLMKSPRLSDKIWEIDIPSHLAVPIHLQHPLAAKMNVIWCFLQALQHYASYSLSN